MPARNTLVQLLAPYTNPESHNAQRHRQTGRRSTGIRLYSRSYCVAARSANYALRQPNCRLTIPPRGTPANIRIHLIFLETRVIDLHSATNSMCLPSFNSFSWVP